MSDENDRCTETFAAREEFWSSLGKLESHVLAPLVNPSFMGGPRWPAMRQSWRTIHRGKNIAIVSDGLTDPFDDAEEPSIGFGYEMFAETNDKLDDNLAASWLFHVVYQLAQIGAHHHEWIANAIEEFGVFTLEIGSNGLLEPVETDQGRAGILIGIAPPNVPTKFELPGGTARLLVAKLITPAELSHVLENGDKGREELASKIEKSKSPHVSSLERKSVY